MATNEQDIFRLLVGYINSSKKLHNDSLANMQELMESCGNPHQSLKIVHIAGTSGKSSTAYKIADYLQTAGLKIGLLTSPHVYSITERIMINTDQLSRADFYDELKFFINIIKKTKFEPSFFEVITAFAFWLFNKNQVDYAVIETGIGGLLDSTNIAKNPNKICVITDIGFDHTEVLGDTIEKIAKQKAGIIHNKNTVFVAEQSTSATKIIEGYAKKQSANLVIVPKLKTPSSSFMEQNEFLAKTVARNILLTKHSDAPKNVKKNQQNLPGRLQKVENASETLIFDGAHNKQKINSLVDTLKKQYPKEKFAVLVALKQSKDALAFLTELKPIVEVLIATEFLPSKTLPAKPHSAEGVAVLAKKIGYSEVIVEVDNQKAFKMLKSQKTKQKLVTGSFYLIGQLNS